MPINHKNSYLFISLVVIGFLGGGWYFYSQMFQGIKDPLKAVPEDAAIIVEIPDFGKFIANWDHGSPYEKAFLDMPYIDDLSPWLTAFVSQLDNETENFSDWTHTKLVISIHQKGYLVLFPSGGMSLQDFRSLIDPTVPKNIKLEEKTIENKYYLKTYYKKHQLLFSEKRGLLIISNSIELLEDAILQTHKTNNFTKSSDFISLQKVSGKRSDAHIFVNYQNLENLSAEVLSKLPAPVWNHQSEIGNWTGLDLNLKPNELLLNGYTIISDTAANFLNILRDQKAIGMILPDNFPYNTYSYKHLSISDYNSYFASWKAYLHHTQQWGNYEPYFQKIQKYLKTESQESNIWWAGEMAQIRTNNGKEYALFLAKNGRDSFRDLSEVAHLSQPSMITLEYRGIKLKEINFPSYLFTQFGPWFSQKKKTYFAVVDELVIFAYSINDLKAYIDLLEDGHILSKNEAYHHFSDNLSKNANLSIYIKHPNSKTQLFDLLDANFKKKIQKTNLYKKSLSGFSLQMSWKNRMIYTGLFTSLEGHTQKNTSQWQVNIDSEIKLGPFVVTDHTDGKSKYVVFDEFRQMYLINEQGDIVWKKQLDELPISQVFEVDYYKNGKVQYLFNSENYIYLIDLTGQMVKGYPVSLNSNATAGLSLMDYNSNKDYRIFVPTANSKIYNYKKDGSLLKDWKSKNTRRTISKPISHVVANSKDYLIAEADNGNILMFNRKGEIRLEIRKSFTNALGSDIYSNRTNSKGMMVTTDTDGLFVYIPEKGKVQSTNFGSFSKDHFFIYTDFSGNGNYDFVYLDGQTLTVFDRFKKTILSYVFEHPIKNKPQLFTVAGRKVLGVLDEEASLLYLFNSDGLISKKIKGNTGFVIESGRSKNSVVLIGKGKALMKYPF